LRRYETTFVVNPQADDATIDRQVTAILDIIKSDGGQILRENRMGTRRLAYEVAGLTQGYYTSIIFESEPIVLPRLDRHYKLEEPYVRFLTVRFEGDPNAESHGLFEESSERATVNHRMIVRNATAAAAVTTRARVTAVRIPIAAAVSPVATMVDRSVVERVAGTEEGDNMSEYGFKKRKGLSLLREQDRLHRLQG
jgi:small subunit ribosomal protein S6